MAKKLMKGNEAICEGALRGGCRAFFGYPITPQNEIPEYMSHAIYEHGGTFVQAESEVSAINMVYGAGGAGVRAMTSSSSPGISLKQEGISYIAGAEIPCVIVNIMRAGPGLGGIQPAQGDYFQTTKGGGHGDYRLFVYAPGTVQEAVDIMYDAFEKAEEYRMPVMILGDGMLGQMMEPVELPEFKDLTKVPYKEWATQGDGKGRRVINSLYINPDELEVVVDRLYDRYEVLKEKETKFESFMTEDAEIVLVAYGSTARIAKSAVILLREKGIKAGIVRPITLFPYPEKEIARVANLDCVKKFVTVELSKGQMVEDVRLAVNGKKPVEFFGRHGGNIMTEEDIVAYIMEGQNG